MTRKDTPMTTSFNLAFEATCQGIKDGTLDEVLTYILNSNSTELKSGAVSALFAVYDALTSIGATFDANDSQRDRYLSKSPAMVKIELLQAMNTGDTAGTVWMVGTLAGACTAAKSQLTFSKAITVPKPEPKPIEVKVIALPARETTSLVTRDNNGNISAATQLERDA